MSNISDLGKRMHQRMLFAVFACKTAQKFRQPHCGRLTPACFAISSARFRHPSRFFLCSNLSFVAQLLSPDFTIHRSGWSARIPSGEPAPFARAPTCRIGSFRSSPARQAGASSQNPALHADPFRSSPAFRAISPVRTALAVDASLANVECAVQRELAQDIPLDLIRLGQGALPLAVRGDGGSGVFEADRVVDLLRA